MDLNLNKKIDLFKKFIHKYFQWVVLLQEFSVYILRLLDGRTSSSQRAIRVLEDNPSGSNSPNYTAQILNNSMGEVEILVPTNLLVDIPLLVLKHNPNLSKMTQKVAKGLNTSS